MVLHLCLCVVFRWFSIFIVLSQLARIHWKANEREPAPLLAACEHLLLTLFTHLIILSLTPLFTLSFSLFDERYKQHR
eukprot:TRINITY_DN24930_c0_g1_i1.p2 TRINITY_DN24930_c0_g1~~TRINITY_DN24930_c0_g1_i1.p2  ORF type:complete len:78 (+),score=20.54 TRINITY_DN24930_c0_g1_i1:172-405(+)